MKRIRVTRHIAAPPEAVFDVILDVDRYPEWNPFTPRTTARVLALDRERYHFCMGTSRTRGRPGIKSFRWQKCEPSPGGGTDFENYESFHGPLGPLVYLLFRKRLKRGFEKYCVALEARVLELNRRL
jgi:hypothetical protein